VSSILEIPEVRQRVSPLSVAEYHRLGEFNENGRRTELIRGIVIEKMSKSPQHTSLATRLFRIISGLLPAGFVARKEEPLTLTDSEPEPDLAVVRGEEKDFAHAHPATADLVVEVAISSAALDRANVSLYAEAGVNEYWIVLGGREAVEVYCRPLGSDYTETRIYERGDTISCVAVPEIILPVDAIFD